jgi:hypothetical protein
VKLFQSIFGRGETRGRYPEALVEAAIERAVDGSDPRLRLLPGYRRHLRGPVIQAADHVIALVDAIPAFITAGRREHATDPRLGALFASASDMLGIFARDRALTELLATAEGRGAARITTLVLCERTQRNVLGMEVVGDQVRRDIPQVVVTFSGHRLLDPRGDEGETRRQLKRRAFDHLLTLALGRIAEAHVERADLVRQRDLLRRKLAALLRGGWSFESGPDVQEDAAELTAELDAITGQLEALGAEGGLLRAHLEIVTEVLSKAEHQLWGEDITLCLDAMNVVRPIQDPSARQIALRALYNARGRQAVLLPLSFSPSELPAREDFLTAAQRILPGRTI